MNHDADCERGTRLIRPGPWKSFEPFIRDNHRCHCNYRRRMTMGFTQPPALDLQGRCCGCSKHPKRRRHDPDGPGMLVCSRCQVAWNEFGRGWWLDYHGDLGEPVITPELVEDKL